MESDDSDIGEMLEDLLANAEESTPQKTLQELNFNFLDSQKNSDSSVAGRVSGDAGAGLVHERDVDSSDDEDRRDFEFQNYSDSGRDLKNLLKKENSQSSAPVKTSPKSEKPQQRPAVTPSSLSSLGLKVSKKKPSTDFSPTKSRDVYSDPIFGLRLVKPLISSASLVERMRGRTAVTVSRVKSHLATEKTSDDWVIAGVLISKSTTKTSQKGSQYCVWKLSDLSERLATVSIFLFSGAYKLFWKTTTGTVVGILNPNALESRDDADEATLSVDNAQKIMILGNSRDMARCKSMKRNGEPCSNVVNLSRCEYCVYHVKQEYNKASRRADIQSNASGRGFSSTLGQKKKTPLAGIYSQGNQTFNQTPVLAKRNAKLYEKDSARLALLRSGNSLPDREVKMEDVDDTKRKKKACAVELTTHQVKKDLERLNKLRGWNVGKQMNFATASEASTLNSPTGSSSASPKSPTSRVASISSSQTPVSRPGAVARGESIELSESVTKNSSFLLQNSQSSRIASISPQNSQTQRIASISSPSMEVPRLGAGARGGSIDFTEPITKRHVNTARLNAMRWIKQNGDLKQSNPNKIRESKEKKNDAGAKRRREVEEADDESRRAAKKAANATNDRFKEMMEAKSAHVDLVEKSQNEEKEKYFEKLEIKERMEEKMMTTFKVDCKAVKCLICKYTSFSASDLCKEQKHPLRVINAVKSFFRCSDCGNRTVSLDRIPSQSCKKCAGSHWVRAAMMAEKNTDIAGGKLSIRGGEEKFIGSVCNDANVNLCVPDSGTGAH